MVLEATREDEGVGGLGLPGVVGVRLDDGRGDHRALAPREDELVERHERGEDERQGGDEDPGEEPLLPRPEREVDPGPHEERVEEERGEGRPDPRGLHADLRELGEDRLGPGPVTRPEREDPLEERARPLLVEVGRLPRVEREEGESPGAAAPLEGESLSP